MPEETTPLPHKSVLTNEVLEYLNPQPGKVYLDATFGVGGHTRAILEHEPRCSVIALDWDTTALDRYGLPLQEEFPGRLRLIWGNFALLYRLLKKNRIKSVDGVLADFGTSQVQITERPGFSVYRDTDLDMRMSPSHHSITAYEIVNTFSEAELRDIFWQFGEERHTKRIVDAIVRVRAEQPIKTTKQLAAVIYKAVPKTQRPVIHPATRVFQALRIYVNKELDNIQSFLRTLPSVLNPGGRAVCISFHSLEDRLVKRFFKEQKDAGMFTVLTPKVVVASEQERTENPSSRSAKLRAAERR